MRGGTELGDPHLTLLAAMRMSNAMSAIETHLASEGLVLPAAAAPVAAYVPTVLAGGLLHISGQLPFSANGVLMTGKLSADPTGEERDLIWGAAAAERCALMLVAQMKATLGDLDRVERIVKLGAFIASTANFTDQPKVANGASEMMVRIFGDAGRHARSAVGVPVLPLDASVEIDAIVAVRA
jgi:enamine deaminase RidA (YjgF/YER057c/UK114 family)